MVQESVSIASQYLILRVSYIYHVHREFPILNCAGTQLADAENAPWPVDHRDSRQRPLWQRQL
jgi:hypothetical protein